MLKNKYQNNLLNLAFIALINFFLINKAFSKALKNEIIEEAQKSMVLIQMRSSISLGYPNFNNSINLIGSLIDKENGIIVTKKSFYKNIISNYIIRFNNGREIKGKLIYEDPWVNFSFIKVNPKEIPNGIQQINFVNRNPKMNQKIFIVDSDDKNISSIQRGIISNLNTISKDLMPQQLINLSMNASASDNISPVFDQAGNAIGLKIWGGDTHAPALHPEYIRYALKYIKQNKKPIRNHIGVITKMYSLAQAFKMRKFPKKKLVDHAKRFGKSRMEAIQVVSTLKGSPAENKLLNGDIIWSVNKIRVGPSLVDFDMIMNNAHNNKIEIIVLRSILKTNSKSNKKDIEWKEVKLEIKLYDLYKNKINKIFKFGNNLLFEADELYSNLLNVPLKTLIIRNFHVGIKQRLLIKNTYLKIENINNQKINSFNHFIEVFRNIKKIKTFALEGNLYDFETSFICKGNQKVDYNFDEDQTTQKYIFNNKNKAWEVINII
ncbi:MAG: serine protease [Bacteroidetes bacterium]|nr:serine protease [Bacteroidota bacterium]